MHKRRPNAHSHISGAILVALLVTVMAMLLQLPLQAQEKQAAKTAPSTKITASVNKTAAPTSSDYVGSDTCITCHSDEQDRFKHTVMGKAFEHPKTEAEKLGCEGCHGPGKAHVEAGGGKDTIPIRFGTDSKNSVEEKNSACLTCHQKGARLFWQGSPHESRQLACVDCHNVKQAKNKSLSSDARFNTLLSSVETQSLKKDQPELCLSCHQMRRAQLLRSSHMPYREGKVTCSSCHNPHGSPYAKQLLQATVNENCLSCHTERRGPFLHEHPPVMENCLNCHDAHGSNNPQLLKVRAPRLCDSCHVSSRHPVQPQPLSSVKVFNRGCTNCHSAIHGSNHPSGSAFLR